MRLRSHRSHQTLTVVRWPAVTSASEAAHHTGHHAIATSLFRVLCRDPLVARHPSNGLHRPPPDRRWTGLWALRAAVVLFIFCVFAFAKRPFGALAICLAVIPLLDMPYEHSYTKRENLLGGFVEKLEL